MTNGQLTSTALAWQTLAGPSPPASFLVYATPVCQSVAGGGRVNWSVNAAYDVAYAAFPGSVDLSVAGLPTGATAGFSAASVSPGSAASILTVASGTAAAGAYSLTISGTSAGVTYNATVTFTITGQ